MCWRSTTEHSSRRRAPCRPPRLSVHHNDGPVADPPWHPLPFHAVFDAPIYDGVRQAHSKPFRPKAAAQLETRIRELANERLDQLLPRGHVRPHPGLRRNRRRIRGMRIPGNTSRFSVRGAGLGQCGQPCRTRQRRRHRAVAAQLPGLPGPVGETAARRHFGRPVAGGGRSDGLPAARRQRARRRRSGHSDAVRVHRRHRNRAQDRGARSVGAAASSRPTGRRAGRPESQRARRPRGDDPLLRARAVVRPNRPQAVHHPRHHDRAGPADHHPARIGQPR